MCPDEGVVVTSVVVNHTGQAFSRLDARDTVLRTGAVLDITSAYPSGALAIGGVTEVPIFSNAYKDMIRPAGEAVAVVVTGGDHSISARYEFRGDGCLVQEGDGPPHPGPRVKLQPGTTILPFDRQVPCAVCT